MLTEAITLGVFSLLTAIFANFKSIYETSCSAWERWRTHKASREDVVVSQLEKHIMRLGQEINDLRAEVNYLNSEYTDTLAYEEEIWGYLRMYHEMMRRQLPPDQVPQLPQKRVRRNRDEFRKRMDETNVKLATAASAIIAPLPPTLPLPPPTIVKGETK